MYDRRVPGKTRLDTRNGNSQPYLCTCRFDKDLQYLNTRRYLKYKQTNIHLTDRGHLCACMQDGVYRMVCLENSELFHWNHILCYTVITSSRIYTSVINLEFSCIILLYLYSSVGPVTICSQSRRGIWTILRCSRIFHFYKDPVFFHTRWCPCKTFHLVKQYIPAGTHICRNLGCFDTCRLDKFLGFRNTRQCLEMK